MHAFEQIVAEILERKGYWVQAEVKVELTKQTKKDLGNPSMPRPEIDIVAYHAENNALLLIECKSYFDSQGVVAKDLMDPASNGAGRYKLFTKPDLRAAIQQALTDEFVKNGRCRPDPTVQYWLVCGKIKAGDEETLKNHFEKQNWVLHDKKWLAGELEKAAKGKYENLVSTMVAKILIERDSK